jgi:hypothetical protein
MARIVDDIVHYFRQHNVDILHADMLYSLMIDNSGPLMDALRRRSYPEADLLRTVVQQERELLRLEEETVELWRRNSKLRAELAKHQPEEKGRPCEGPPKF